ncbi:MAG: PilN domain-containing protein [Aureliella sp.]
MTNNKLGQSLLRAVGKTSQPMDRRQSSKRRLGHDRRKQASLTIGMEVSPGGVAVAFSKPAGDGERAIVTEFYPFTASETKGDHDQWSKVQLTQALTDFKEKHRVAGQAVIVALGGETCITRAWFGENETVDSSIQDINERTNRYISLGVGPKISCYTESPIDAKRKRAWVTVANRQVVQNVADSIEQAGLRLIRMEHTLGAFCGAIGSAKLDQSEPILVAAGTGKRTGVAISYQGHLILDYRPTSEEKSGSSEKEHQPHGHDLVVYTVEKHLKRLRRFAAKRLADGENELNRICFPGRQEVPAELERVLKSEYDLEVVRLPLSAICGATGGNMDGTHSDSPEVMVAVWLAQQNELPQNPHTVDIAQSLFDREKLTLARIVKVGWPIAAALMLALGMHGWAYSKTDRVTRLEARLESMQPKRIELLRTKQELTRFMEKNENSVRLKQHLRNPQWSELVRVTGRTLPEGSWLQSIHIEHEGTALIKGTSFSAESIYDYVESLKQIGVFQHVTLGATKKVRSTAGPALDFEITATLAEFAFHPSNSGSEVL